MSESPTVNETVVITDEMAFNIQYEADTGIEEARGERSLAKTQTHSVDF